MIGMNSILEEKICSSFIHKLFCKFWNEFIPLLGWLFIFLENESSWSSFLVFYFMVCFVIRLWLKVSESSYLKFF